LLFLLYIPELVAYYLAAVIHDDEHEAKANKIEQTDVHRAVTIHSKKSQMNTTEMKLMSRHGLTDVELTNEPL
jgi:hypothetical protein